MTKTADDRPRITLAILLLAANGRMPDRLYRALCRAYGLGADARLRWQASRPGRFRLMVSEGCGEPVEWVRWSGRYRVPIATAAEAVARLRESERRQPELCWWIEPGAGARWRWPARFDDDFRELLT